MEKKRMSEEEKDILHATVKKIAEIDFIELSTMEMEEVSKQIGDLLRLVEDKEDRWTLASLQDFCTRAQGGILYGKDRQKKWIMDKK